MFSAEKGQAAKKAMDVAVEALAKAKGTAKALDEAEAVAAQRGASEDKDLSDKELAAMVKAVYLISEQPGSRSSHNTKGKALAFLGELGLPWAEMLPGVRARCDAAVAEAETAVAKAKPKPKPSWPAL